MLPLSLEIKDILSGARDQNDAQKKIETLNVGEVSVYFLRHTISCYYKEKRKDGTLKESTKTVTIKISSSY